MEFEKCNPIFLVSAVGVVLIGLALVLTHQDGVLLKGVLVLLGIGLGAHLPSGIFRKE